jgi:acyl-CoA thioesterase-1
MLSLRVRMVVFVLCAFMSSCSSCSFGVGVEPDSGSGASPASPVAAPAPHKPKIVALGDSLTAGLGLLESQAYPAILQQRLVAEGYDFEVVNAGVSGDTSAGALRRLDWALDGDVRVLIVAVGANDGLRGLSVAEMKQNLSEIVSRARARNVTVVLAGMEAPPNYGQEYALAFHRAFGDVARQERVSLIPFLLDKVAGRGELNQEDGIHPNAQGAQIVADNVWAVLRPILDQMTDAR